MPRYEILSRSEVQDRNRFVADLTVQGRCAYLKIKEPTFHFIREHPMGELASDHAIIGLANKPNRTIYIAGDLGLDQTIETTAHECKHIADYDNVGFSKEADAELFAEESWPPNLRGQSYEEIILTLGEMNLRTGLQVRNLQVAEYGMRLLRAAKSSVAYSLEPEFRALRDQLARDEQKIMEVRRKYYEHGVKARAAAYIKPNRRHMFPPNIEFFTSSIKWAIK